MTPDPEKRPDIDVSAMFEQARATVSAMADEARDAAILTAEIARGAAVSAGTQAVKLARAGAEVALDAVDAAESAASNEAHKWVPKSSSVAGPFLLAGGAVIALAGIKGVAVYVGAKAVMAAGAAIVGKATAYRGFRAIRPLRRDGETPPAATVRIKKGPFGALLF